MTECESPIAVIESLTHEGVGVARIHGKATFIEGGLPGERVQYEITRRGKHYDQGRTSAILSASTDRVTPRCQHFGTCGGCSLQHLRSDAQLPVKQQVLQDALERIGHVSPLHWRAPLTGPAWAYRRRARLGARFIPEQGGALVGFRKRHSAHITPITHCAVLAPRIADRLPDLASLIAGLSQPDRVPQIEVALGDQEGALVFRHLAPFSRADIGLLCDFGQRHQLQIYSQPGEPDSITPIWPAQPQPLSYHIDDDHIEIRFEPTDFIQVNADINRRLVAEAMMLLDLRADDRVLDLFCGLGNFTLPIARRAQHVLGVEANASLVLRARDNAARNQIDNAEFITANLYHEDAALPWEPSTFNKWLLDPPRTGAAEIIKTLAPGQGPARIVYISCNPATLARDSAILVGSKGYRLLEAGVLDMFPQTSHVESVALFDRTPDG